MSFLQNDSDLQILADNGESGFPDTLHLTNEDDLTLSTFQTQSIHNGGSQRVSATNERNGKTTLLLIYLYLEVSRILLS